MKYRIAPVNNIERLKLAYQMLEDAPHGVPRMGLVYGFTGVGKTTAISWLMTQTDAIVVKASPTWSLHSMLAKIMVEIGIAPMGRSADMEEAIVEKMQKDQRPLFVDEADAFTDPQVRGDRSYAILETLRSIHDMSKMPVMLIGMDGIERRLASRHQLMRRISQWVKFEPATLADARILSDTVCEVHVADDLLSRLCETSGGSIGLMMVGLSRIERSAKASMLASIGLDVWGNRPFNLRGDIAQGASHESP
ncbi:MAG: ATP-binding protein [Methylotetracoccus sp.]